MEVPSQVTPAFWGAVCGAAAVALIGFTKGGWVAMPGAASVDTAIAASCAEQIIASKS